jgi:hypothetical protein
VITPSKPRSVTDLVPEPDTVQSAPWRVPESVHEIEPELTDNKLPRGGSGLPTPGSPGEGRVPRLTCPSHRTVTRVPGNVELMVHVPLKVPLYGPSPHDPGRQEPALDEAARENTPAAVGEALDPAPTTTAHANSHDARFNLRRWAMSRAAVATLPSRTAVAMRRDVLRADGIACGNLSLAGMAAGYAYE